MPDLRHSAPPAPLGPGSVGLWLAGDDDEAARRAEPLLDADERARLGRFIDSGAARLFAVAHGLARQALAAAGGGGPGAWHLGGTREGRPLPRGPAGAPDLGVSLSHTGGLVAVAVAAATDVGVDVERHDAALPARELARFLSRAEAAAVLAADDQAAEFVRRWCLKEAYAKARGLGMALPFESFTVTPAPALPPDGAEGGDGADGPAGGPRPATIEGDVDVEVDGWRLWELAVGPGHALALALGPAPPGAPPPTVAVRRVVTLLDPLLPPATVLPLP